VSGGAVPPYLRPGTIAKLCKITKGTMLTQLRQADLIEWRGGERWVNADRLRDVLPAIYGRVFRRFGLTEKPHSPTRSEST
jgi:hypothetical protein